MLKMKISRGGYGLHDYRSSDRTWFVDVTTDNQIYRRAFATRAAAREYVATMHAAHAPDCGYDGAPIKPGDRIELHPATDLWMRGARFGTVRGVSLTDADKFRIELDKLPGRLFSCSKETLRRTK